MFFLLKLVKLVPELLLQGDWQHQEPVDKAEQGQDLLPCAPTFVEAPQQSQLPLLALGSVPDLPRLEVSHHHHGKGIGVLFQRGPIPASVADLHDREKESQKRRKILLDGLFPGAVVVRGRSRRGHACGRLLS